MTALRVLSVLSVFLLVTETSAGLVPPNEAGGKRTTGWDGALSVAFVHAGQHSVTGLARVIVAGHAPSITNPVDCISAAYFKYRWRRLSIVPKQTWGDEIWETLPMVKIGTDLLATTRELTVPDFPCDLEFYFVATSIVPYYKYVDYTGLDIGVGDYTEEPQRLIVSHLQLTGDELLGSCGKEWFVRVRDGKSLIQGVNVK